ncbi:MAG: hypothetical protein Q8Q46_01870 [Candidatus Giovannonibacteria bacterium]|nr:hypothetical protein [Candidatus Giovannonibacteria bacterium]
MPKEITIDDLARMVQGGFKEVNGKFNDANKHLVHIDGRLDHLDARMGRMETDLAEIKGEIVYKYEFEDLSSRVKYLETKLGVESGK